MLLMGAALVFPATILEVLPDQTLVLKYDHGGGEGVELPEHVRPRVTMPHHPKDVPLHMMLRRNIGLGHVGSTGRKTFLTSDANLLLQARLKRQSAHLL